jgi:hypothetical protein
MWKKLGRIVSAPIRIPIEKGKRKVMASLASMVLRNGLKMAGMASLFSDSEVQEAAGAIALIAGLAWSGFNTWREMQAKKPA